MEDASKGKSGTGQAMVVALVATHGSQLRRFLLTRVRDSSDVPDLMQEIFLRMLRIPNHEVIRSPEAYLFTVAQHVAHQHAIRGARMAQSIELREMLAELSEVPQDPAEELLAQQSLREMESVLRHLSARERATFLWHRRDGLTLQVVAERLGVSRQMVKKYLAKALCELRNGLEGND